MHFAFTEEQLAIGELVRNALAAECTPAVVRAAATQRSPALWGQLAALGVLGVELPEEAGGLDMGPSEWILALEAAGYHALPLPLAETVALLPALDSDLAAAVADGTATVALAPQGGFAVDADLADAVFVIEGDRLCRVARPDLVRHHSADETRWLFDVAGDRVAVGPAAPVVQRATLATAAQLLGLGRRMLDLAVDYAKARRQFGKPIGAFQAVQHHLADALLELEFAAPAVYRAGWSLSVEHASAQRDISMAKALAGDAARVARRKSLQVHGAIGFAHECDLQLYLLRAVALEGAWGDAARHRQGVADALSL